MTVSTLVSLDDLKAYVKLADDSQEFDRQLVELGGAATALLEVFCRATFARKAFSEKFSTIRSTDFQYDLTGNTVSDFGLLEQNRVQRFPLRGYPVDASLPVTVKYDPDRVFGSGAIKEATGYYLNANTNALYLLDGTAQTTFGLQIEYTAGYTVENATYGDDDQAVTYQYISGAPPTLRMACIQQVIFMFNKIQEGNVGVVGRGSDNSPEYASNALLLCPEAQALASSFKRVLVGRR